MWYIIQQRYSPICTNFSPEYVFFDFLRYLDVALRQCCNVCNISITSVTSCTLVCYAVKIIHPHHRHWGNAHDLHISEILHQCSIYLRIAQPRSTYSYKSKEKITLTAGLSSCFWGLRSSFSNSCRAVASCKVYNITCASPVLKCFKK